MDPWSKRCRHSACAAALPIGNDLPSLSGAYLPAGVLYAASLWLSNSAYLYLSVSFIQMTKSLMPGLVYASGVALGTEQHSVGACRWLLPRTRRTALLHLTAAAVPKAGGAGCGSIAIVIVSSASLLDALSVPPPPATANPPSPSPICLRALTSSSPCSCTRPCLLPALPLPSFSGPPRPTCC